MQTAMFKGNNRHTVWIIEFSKQAVTPIYNSCLILLETQILMSGNETLTVFRN